MRTVVAGVGETASPDRAIAQVILSIFGFHEVTVYFTDRGIEELGERRGGYEVTLGWLARADDEDDLP